MYQGSTALQPALDALKDHLQARSQEFALLRPVSSHVYHVLTGLFGLQAEIRTWLAGTTLDAIEPPDLDAMDGWRSGIRTVHGWSLFRQPGPGGWAYILRGADGEEQVAYGVILRRPTTGWN